jgi:predicted aminopeptidase
VTEGYDVSLRGVLAFSTLGWFADPVMNMHLRVSPSLLAGIIFHETAHERLYIKDDTAYNEAFATFVGHKGQFLWIHKHYGNEEAEKFLLGEKRLEEFSSLITHIRLKLHLMYLEKPPADETRRLKQKIFSELHEKYAALKRSWGGYGGFDEWIGRPPNNADLAGENEYRKLIPFFQKLFELSGKNFPAFYAKAEMIGNFSKMERYLEIEKIMSK